MLIINFISWVICSGQLFFLWNLEKCWKTPTTRNKIYGTILRNHAKLDSIRNLWYLLFRNFWPLVLKFYFWRKDWVLGSRSSHIWAFHNISYFFKVLRCSATRRETPVRCFINNGHFNRQANWHLNIKFQPLFRCSCVHK